MDGVVVCPFSRSFSQPGSAYGCYGASRQQFIKDFDLRSVSRRNLVRYLAPQVISSEASVGASLANAGTKERRAEEIQRVTGLAYEVGQTSSTPLLRRPLRRNRYPVLCLQHRLSRQQANEAAVKALIVALKHW